MRSLAAIALVAVFASLLVAGCEEEVFEPPPPAPPPDPGWPTLSLQDAAIQYQLDEAHYHMRKGRHAAGNSFGSEFEMPISMGYTQWAFANALSAAEAPSDDPKVQSRREALIAAAMSTADHLILEHGSQFDAPQGYTPRCKWCRYPMPSSLRDWPIEGGERVVECPRCTARNSFPVGLVLSCTHCHHTVVGTAAAGQKCPSCSQDWRGARKQCSHCHLQVDMMRRQGQACPRCKSRWNFDTPFGNWPSRAPVLVKDPLVFDVSTQEGDLRIMGVLRPRHVEPAAPAAPAAAGPGAGPGMGPDMGMGMDPGMGPGMEPGMGPGGPPGGPGMDAPPPMPPGGGGDDF